MKASFDPTQKNRAAQLRLRGQRNYSRYMQLTKGLCMLTVRSIAAGSGNRLCETGSGTNVMVRSREARAL